MLGKPLLVILALAVAVSDGVNRGSIQVEGYGEVWVISPDWANVQVDSGGNAFTLHGNSRMYFASRGRVFSSRIWETIITVAHY